MTCETIRVETSRSLEELVSSATSLLLPFQLHFCSPNPRIARMRSALVTTSLVPILALLASVRAAPPSGLQSRGNPPFAINFIEPVLGQHVPRGGPLNVVL
jgi:hypothetical protein